MIGKHFYIALKGLKLQISEDAVAPRNKHFDLVQMQIDLFVVVYVPKIPKSKLCPPKMKMIRTMKAVEQGQCNGVHQGRREARGRILGSERAEQLQCMAMKCSAWVRGGRATKMYGNAM